MENLTEEQLKEQEVKADKETKAQKDKAAKEAKAAQAKNLKVKVHFGVEIPGVGSFTKEDIEASEDIQNMLLEIKSGAVTKL